MKRLAPLILLLVCFSISAQEKCTLNISQAPTIRGLKLGMPLEELRGILPSYHFKNPESLGILSGTITAQQLRKAKAVSYDGLRSVGVLFLDGKLAYAEFEYDATYRWANAWEFTQKLSDTLRIPKAWETTQTPDTQMMICEDFYLQASLTPRREGWLKIQKIGLSEITAGRRADEEKRKREGFKP
jgi:hypothetical protein